MDKKSIYVADTGNDVIRKIDITRSRPARSPAPAKKATRTAPRRRRSSTIPARSAPTASFLYVLDADNHSIRKIDLNANTVTKLTLVNGHIGSGCALTSDGKQLYFSDTTENAVEVVDTTSGNFTTLYPPGQYGPRATGIAILIDLRSDTVTLPTPEMREAIARAELGDDVYGEDPTVNRLEAMAASMMGKDAALLVPSGTMGNLAAMLTHCARGTKAIVGSQSHTNLYEAGGASALGGIVLTAIANTEDGELDTR